MIVRNQDSENNETILRYFIKLPVPSVGEVTFFIRKLTRYQVVFWLFRCESLFKISLFLWEVSVKLILKIIINYTFLQILANRFQLAPTHRFHPSLCAAKVACRMWTTQISPETRRVLDLYFVNENRRNHVLVKRTSLSVITPTLKYVS